MAYNVLHSTKQHNIIYMYTKKTSTIHDIESRMRTPYMVSRECFPVCSVAMTQWTTLKKIEATMALIFIIYSFLYFNIYKYISWPIKNSKNLWHVMSDPSHLMVPRMSNRFNKKKSGCACEMIGTDVYVLTNGLSCYFIWNLNGISRNVCPG